MRKLYVQLRGFIQEDFDWRVYAGTGLFLGILLFGSTGDGFLIQRTYGNPDLSAKFLWFLAVIAAPYLVTVLLQVVFDEKSRNSWSLPQPWLLFLFGLLMVAGTMWFPFHVSWAKTWFSPELRRWGIILLWHAKRIPFMVLPMLIYVWANRKGDPGLLGLRYGDSNLGTYFLILALVLPLIIIASFQEGFIQAYPYYNPKPSEAQASIGVVPRMLVAETAYLVDFVVVEWIYRGFWILAFTKWLGPKAVLPMAAMYCAIHMGKPLGEAIASFFGGYALGVFASKSRSVWGGVIVHVGVAASMDAMALIQKYVFQGP